MTVTKVNIVKKHWLSGIWLLPLVGALMASWIVFQNAQEKGIEISIIFEDAAGITAGKTLLMYKGVRIGLVKSVQMSDNFKQIKVMAEVEPSVVDGLRKTTGFWLVKPSISLTEITGLDTIVSGDYISMNPGVGEPQREFIALNSPPILFNDSKSLYIDLMVGHLGSIVRGSKIYFREIPVGEVLDYTLLALEDQVKINVRIEERYTHLIQKSSRFWNASDLSVKVGLSDFSVHTESLAALISGGIAFYTPKTGVVELAENGEQFQLYEDFEAAEVEVPETEKSGSQFIQIVADELGSLTIGSKVYFKKIPVGELINYALSPKNNILITLEIKQKYLHLISRKTRFWRNSGIKIKAGLSGVKVDMASVQALLNGGISFANVEGWRTYKVYKGRRRYPLYQDADLAKEQVKNIRIEFDLAEGIHTGTELKYLGIKVGEVTQVKLAADNQSIIAHAKLFASATNFARKGAKFWLVSADIGLFKSKHLGTLIKGNYIQIEPGSGSKKSRFKGQLFLPEIKQGLHVILKSPELGSIKISNPVMYRQVKVGEVRGYRLENNAQYVLIDIYIAQKYAALVQDNSKFWNVSGLKVDLGLFTGAEIRADSLESIVIGGIAFATPTSDPEKRVINHQVFNLHDDYQQSWLDWTPKIKLGN
ncbi:MAG: MlaD family protein [Methyloprofundus sp.]|nr:MlaD family protein [Methyloprofundus sp.]